METPSAAARVAARFDMSGRRALVTGGSLSIGRAVTVAFAEAGADVAIHYSPPADLAFGFPDAARDAVAEVEALGRRAVAIAADFELPGEARRTVMEADKALGGIDVLVVCASIQYRTAFAEVTAEQIERQIRINFTATIELLQAAAPPMRQRGFGRILTIGSINEKRPEAELSVYAALKIAQHNLAINLAKQYAGDGVTVNNLSPGLIATERNRWRREDAAAWDGIQKRANPMGRAGTPDEIAAGALLLCANGAGFITGADLEINGGHHL